MRIGLNATCFNDRPSGANQRFRSLYGAVIRRNPAIEFVVYEPADCRVASWFGDARNVTARRTPLPSAGRIARLWAGLGYWRRAVSADALDLIESFSLPLIPMPCPQLLTIHDLRPIDQPGMIDRIVAPLVLRHAFTRADHVIAVSDVVCGRIAALVPGARVSTVYNGIDAADFREAEITRLSQSLDGFILTVGHLEPRKSIGLLIDAVAVLRDRGARRPLVIAGRDGGARSALRAHVARLGLGDLVSFVEDADDAAIRALYAACRLVAIPSRYEGFGIPLIEAMAARRPLVTSDIAVFREIARDAARTFPIDDARAAAVVIESVWNDPAERARLVAAGDARVADFAIDRLADQIAALYAPVLEEAGRPRIRAMRTRAAANE